MNGRVQVSPIEGVEHGYVLLLKFEPTPLVQGNYHSTHKNSPSVQEMLYLRQAYRQVVVAREWDGTLNQNFTAQKVIYDLLT